MDLDETGVRTFGNRLPRQRSQFLGARPAEPTRFLPAKPTPAFGPRRAPRTAAQPVAPTYAGLLKEAQQRAAVPGRPLVAHYNWRVGLLGASLLGMAWKFAMFWLENTSSMSSIRPAGSGGDPTHLLAAVLLALIGLGWLSRVIVRAPALKIDTLGVTGFTLLGTQHYAWADIDRVEVGWHATYKRQVTIHGIVGSSSVGYGVTGIPVPLSRINRKLDEVLAAIAHFGPDVPVVRLGQPPWWYDALLNMISRLRN